MNAPLPQHLNAGAGREKRFRTVFISDIHLGTSGCRAEELLEFLRCVESDTLFLVGDIVDGWQLKRRWHWPQTHNDIVQKVLRKARKGTRVIFIPGNHDESIRQFCGLQFGDIELEHEAVHVTADGRRLWVTHGDLFDGVVQCARWLAILGDVAYEWALRANRALNFARARLGLPYWSISQWLKDQVKRAVSFVTAFEEALANAARKRGYDGVVCGHIHRAEIRMIGDMLYCNDGDWVESMSALVEHFDGRLEILRWVDFERERLEALGLSNLGRGMPALPAPGGAAARPPAPAHGTAHAKLPLPVRGEAP
jgi:UDP-2,3-diacylglucosamine pyrophosphatase LpxH